MAKVNRLFCTDCRRSLANQVSTRKVESIIRLMQDERTGLPVKMAKSFMSKIPSVFTGADLTQWLLKRLKLDDMQEALHLANLISSHGYIFAVEHQQGPIKNDATFYRFQSCSLWPSSGIDPENCDYAVYLCKRSLLAKSKSELADYEAENLIRLQRTFAHRWDSMSALAESQANAERKRDKLERKLLSSQEKAYWDLHRPEPGNINTTELDIKKTRRLSLASNRCNECEKVMKVSGNIRLAHSSDQLVSEEKKQRADEDLGCGSSQSALVGAGRPAKADRQLSSSSASLRTRRSTIQHARTAAEWIAIVRRRSEISRLELTRKQQQVGTRSLSVYNASTTVSPITSSTQQLLSLAQPTSSSTTLPTADRAALVEELTDELQSLRLQQQRRSGDICTSKLVQSYLSFSRQWADYDSFITPAIPSNPWISDSNELWECERETKDVHSRRIRRWAFSLRELLKDPAGRNQFRRFLEKEFSAENLRFWDSVQELKRVNSRELINRVEAIWNEFLHQDANCPINIDSKSYEFTRRNMENNKRNRCIFDEAAGHVYQLMKNDSYPRFIRSPTYKDYKESSEKKKVNQLAFDVFMPQITTLKQKLNF